MLHLQKGQMLRKTETKHMVIAGIHARAFSAGTAEFDPCILLLLLSMWCVSEIIQYYYWLADRYATRGWVVPTCACSA